MNRSRRRDGSTRNTILQQVAHGATVPEAARYVGLSTAELLAWLRSDPEFKDAMEAAKRRRARYKKRLYSLFKGSPTTPEEVRRRAYLVRMLRDETDAE